MHRSFSRRTWLRIAPLSLPLAQTLQAAPAETTVPDVFPTQPASLVREIVSVAHRDINLVRELVEERPTLAKASWDWGFGDWESPLGAASHVGNREIAEYLISKGARPSIFSATMLGQLDVVKAFVAAQPGVQQIPGPHSLSLLAHAKAGRAQAEPVRKFLESLGDADGPVTVPIPEAEASALAGVYTFGNGPADRIEITFTKNTLTFTRPGASGRRLLHVGGHAFFPAGASAVRIRFDGPVLTVHDPGLVLTALRAKEGAN